MEQMARDGDLVSGCGSVEGCHLKVVKVMGVARWLDGGFFGGGWWFVVGVRMMFYGVG